MNGIDLMIDEHKYIKRMLKVMRRACIGIMNGKEIPYDDFAEMIGFIRNFADKHHHEKEELILFNKMIDEIGEVAKKTIKFGMLVEHDLGRMYVLNLEEALAKYREENDDDAKLDIIANAVSYTNLLNRHIDKEDTAIFMFAKRQLSEGAIDKVNEECRAYEEKKAESGVQDKYINMLKAMEDKYL